MSKLYQVLSGVVMLALIALAQADTLALKNGQSIEGDYQGGTSQSIRFNSGGTTKTYSIQEVEALFLDRTSGSGSAPAAAPAAPPPPPTAPKKVVVPAGTAIMVRNAQTIDSNRQQAGYRFTVRLEADLVADGVVVAKRGSNAYGVLTQANQSGRVAGRSELTLTLTDIMVNNQLKPVVTSDVKAVTDNTAGNTAKKTIGGALLGALIDGKDGALTGAAVGAGASILTKGNSINIPSGTLLEFRLGQPFSP